MDINFAILCANNVRDKNERRKDGKERIVMVLGIWHWPCLFEKGWNVFLGVFRG
jgi:1,4-dihydroxy-2-naphthoate octaprenyltransferase